MKMREMEKRHSCLSNDLAVGCMLLAEILVQFDFPVKPQFRSIVIVHIHTTWQNVVSHNQIFKNLDL